MLVFPCIDTRVRDSKSHAPNFEFRALRVQTNVPEVSSTDRPMVIRHLPTETLALTFATL
jgi:hypothetical protein